MQKLLDKEEIMDKKNGFLQPLYRDIKTTIKHMTYTPEFKVMREYISNRNMVIKTINADSTKGKMILESLKLQYAKLLRN